MARCALHAMLPREAVALPQGRPLSFVLSRAGRISSRALVA